MVVVLIIAGVLAVVFLALWVMTQQKLGGVRDALSTTEAQLTTAKSEISSISGELESTRGEVKTLQARCDGLEGELAGTSARLDDANDTLRKRTELADAQALQIDALSGERDELREEIRTAEEKMASMAARPGVVVGNVVDGVADEQGAGSQFETLWNLELARTERVWRNSVAIDPTSENSPLDGAENPLRQAVEIEADALREDVGALITVEWSAGDVPSAARRLVVLRLAQEMLASAARAPGATSLIVTDEPDETAADSGSGGSEIRLEFTSGETGVEGVNLIPPAVTGPAFEGIFDIRQEGDSTIVLSEPRTDDTPAATSTSTESAAGKTRSKAKKSTPGQKA